jgi:hypothetical protein
MSEEKELPQVEEPAKQEAEAIDVDGLMAQLEKAGVTNAEDLDGKLTAGAQAGRLAQLLGDERKRSEELTEKLAQQPRPQPTQDFMDYGEGQTINIEDAIEKSVTKVFTKQAETNRKAQEMQLGQYNKITQHPNYGFVKDEFEAKLKDPNYVYQVQAGMIDPVGDFYDTVIKKQQVLMKESHKTIEQLAGGGKPPPPHVETGERSPSNLVSETPTGTEAEKRLAALQEKTDKGQLLSQEEELGMIDDIFGTKDPL